MTQEMKRLKNQEKTWMIEKRSYELKFECLKKIINDGKPKYCKDIKMIPPTINGHPYRTPICNELWKQLQSYNNNNNKQGLNIDIKSDSNSNYVINHFNLQNHKIIQAITQFILKGGEYQPFNANNNNDIIKTFKINDHRIHALKGTIFL